MYNCCCIMLLGLSGKGFLIIDQRIGGCVYSRLANPFHHLFLFFSIIGVNNGCAFYFFKCYCCDLRCPVNTATAMCRDRVSRLSGSVYPFAVSPSNAVYSREIRSITIQGHGFQAIHLAVSTKHRNETVSPRERPDVAISRPNPTIQSPGQPAITTNLAFSEQESI